MVRSNRRARPHAILARDMERPGGRERPGGTGGGLPYLPEVGEVYQITALIQTSGDIKAERPCVVVAIPRAAHQRIGIVTRTSDTDMKGVPHPASLELDLNLDGVFAAYSSVEQQLWRSANVRYRGRLPEPWLSEVLELAL